MQPRLRAKLGIGQRRARSDRIYIAIQDWHPSAEQDGAERDLGGERFIGGKFVFKGVKKIFEPYLVEERAKKRILGDLDELFDIELSTAIVLKDMEPLPAKVALCYHPVKVIVPEHPNSEDDHSKSMVNLN